jgi:hypothetical protein
MRRVEQAYREAKGWPGRVEAAIGGEAIGGEEEATRIATER